MARPRVLVVHDESQTPVALQAALTEDGYDVDTAAGGLNALHRFAQQHYDLLISGLRLPDLDGPALYRALCDRWPTAYPQVLFLSGDGDRMPTADGLAGTGALILSRSFSLRALRQLVRRMLGVL